MYSTVLNHFIFAYVLQIYENIYKIQMNSAVN